MAAPDLFPLVAAVNINVPGWVGAILGVAAAFVVVLVVWLAALHVLAAVRGGVVVDGRIYDRDVYVSALNELHRQKRRGVLIDARSARELRRYQGISSGRRRRGL